MGFLDLTSVFLISGADIRRFRVGRFRVTCPSRYHDGEKGVRACERWLGDGGGVERRAGREKEPRSVRSMASSSWAEADWRRGAVVSCGW